jgi:spoIIIJ-associated protein
MNSQRTNLEVIAPSVEEAIDKGIADLGLPLEAVDVEVLDEGSRGLFGIGTRHARVRLIVKQPPAELIEEPYEITEEEDESTPDILSRSDPEHSRDYRQ